MTYALAQLADSILTTGLGLLVFIGIGWLLVRGGEVVREWLA